MSFRINQLPKVALTFVSRLIFGGKTSVTNAQSHVPEAPTIESKHVKKGSGNQLEAQLTQDGAGPLFYRDYSVEFNRPKLSVSELAHLIQTQPNKFTPTELATFKKTKGLPAKLEEGDEFFIEITGPWNGPVRAAKVNADSFVLVTLKGHMEAGEIKFALQDLGQQSYRFAITSWARSADITVDLAYDKIKVAQWAQAEMWTQFCENVARVSGGQQKGDVVIQTEKRSFEGEVVPVVKT